jgi:hypothetical protein
MRKLKDASIRSIQKPKAADSVGIWQQTKEMQKNCVGKGNGFWVM